MIIRLTTALADRYRVERELGQGGMATVFLAHDLKHERDVAIKVLHQDLGAALGGERFLAEIRTTAKLQHPHILPLLDSGEADGLLYYVMPLVTGETLRARLERERQLPIDDALLIAREVADALGYAHGLGVIHRDIKPENILLQGGHALVADFGIALAVQSAGGARMTQTGLSLGTPSYMSPEQAMGERTIDARSDLYALGAVTYEMLAGEAPFTGPSVQAIVARVMSEEPRGLVLQRKAIPDGVEAAVMRALEKLPADRFPSAAAFADALRAPDSVASTRRTSGRTSRGWVAAGVALGLGLGIAGAFVLRPGARGTPPTVRVALDLPAGEALKALFGTPFLATPPNGESLLYLAQGVANNSQYLLRPWDRLSASRTLATVDDPCCGTFSPSGDTLAYLSAPNLLQLLPLTGGAPRTLEKAGLLSVSDFAGGIDWGNDGKIYGVGGDGLLRIDPSTGERTLIAPLDAARGDYSYLWPHLLPGGKGAVVSVTSRAAPFDPNRTSIGIANFATQRVELIQQGLRAIASPTGHLLIVRPTGALVALPFDMQSLRATGAPRELADTIGVRDGNSGPAVVDLVLSSRGTLSYVAGARSSYLATWVDRDGRWALLPDSLTGDVMDGADLSADGRDLVVGLGGKDRELHLFRQRLPRGTNTRLTFDGQTNYRPRFHPGTNRVTYLSDRDRERRGDAVARTRLFERSLNGDGGVLPLAVPDPRAISGFAWSPDGAWLVFRTDDGEPGGGDILAVRPGVDSSVRVLAGTPAEEVAPAVSPDGRWMAYSSNASGRREIFVRPFPDGGDARFQVSRTGGIAPHWHPNGRELFYIDAAGQMTAVPVLASAGFETGQPVTLFSTAPYFTGLGFHQMYAVASDGRFLMVRKSASTEFRVVTVVNFVDELRRRMAEQ